MCQLSGEEENVLGTISGGQEGKNIPTFGVNCLLTLNSDQKIRNYTHTSTLFIAGNPSCQFLFLSNPFIVNARLVFCIELICFLPLVGKKILSYKELF